MYAAYYNALQSVEVFVQRLVWDDWNVVHIARHGVTPADVEAVCHDSNQLLAEGHSGRLLIGLSATGQILAVILAPEGESTYYPVTARPADRRERQSYRAPRETT